ncbi:MAG: retroviral-like aspartic protease family protein [Candidatus Omnitrophica bacterium]|nr:retroviral-like aspartic protease family protein [Candidatus Omnitrophota bacterium]
MTIPIVRRKLALKDGLIVYRAKITSKIGSILLKMALDTGATFTMIPPEATLSIGINPADPSRMREITTGSGTVYCPIVTIPEFTAFGSKVKNLEVFCHTLPPESPVDGLLGLNFLKQFDLRLNFKKGFLEIR